MASIDTSGTVLLRQNLTDVEYSLDNSANWTTAVWPVTLNNTDTPNTLTITFTTDLSLSSTDQYFIIDSSNIVIDGSDNVVNIDLSGNGYPGLVRNGTYSYDGTTGLITANNDAYSDITIQNITLNSNNSSLLAIAPTTSTQANESKYGNGWLCQAYYGLDGSNNIIDNCSSNGGTDTIYWVDASGDTHSDNNPSSTTTQGGCISGNFCDADATNCYSTGTIGSFAGGIFGANSTSSATNCYSIGSIGNGAGGIFGQGSLAGASASNCYSIGTIDNRAGGIFGQFSTNCSATNCYSSGDIGSQGGGIFGFSSSSQAQATNCYSTGTTIDAQTGGIFGQFSGGSATNCYCVGGTTIGGSGTKTYCYSTNGVTNWLDASANDALDFSGNPWTDIDENSEKVPYRLTSFLIPEILYDPSGGENVNPKTPVEDISGNYTWSITSVNGSTTNNEGITIDGSNGNISFGVSSNGTYAVNVLATDQFGKYSYETFTNIISNICFPAGTPIVTNQGIIAINKINPKIHTIRNKKIIAITKTVTPDKYLVRFEKDALGPNLPCEATTMTKDHMLFYKGKMIKAKEFLKTHNDSVSKVPYNGQVLYNVLLEEHDKMVVNNLICETLHPDNYVAQMYRAFKTLTPKQRIEAIQKVNKVVLTEGIYKKPSAKR